MQLRLGDKLNSVFLQSTGSSCARGIQEMTMSSSLPRTLMCPLPSMSSHDSVVRNYSLGPVAACLFMVGFLFQQALTILYLITSPPL